ncbi:bifunctional ADP-dependent NAD(P)H-hydrate dehydratase/NAD(P)H-hydrate epimerase [Thalassotalea sp. PP2-459]|uniref:bifunctional ADP-dependent NAD(P)H-hydrate dehydratase/NAD(P)H-hydrate epimerase n=1 Tax=Thalassotalea sp. PP2-459 TaxID=1742724 RepID=UPI000942A2AD|nr:bifunctional ADP-dependent NAD(P)H-hydrate dehydratase/NAD(P)H-hydrate epimerase [Thalassotalea sp. PP2-459]OKY26836.1 hypothetical protein BI291_02245 [Thalassotalea sp. PP2-459]
MPILKLLRSLPQSAYCATQVLTNEHCLAKEQGLELYALMEKAGQAVFSRIQEQYSKTTQLFILAGKGNNGGDGFVLARLAAEVGYKVTVYLCAEAEQLKGCALTAFNSLQKTTITVLYQSELALTPNFFQENQYELIIDALFGIGYQGALKSELAKIINLVNGTNITIVSIDVPSGLNATTGYVATTAIRASETVTFIAAKQGLMTGQAADFVGQLYLATLSLNECFQQRVDTQIHLQGKNAIPNFPVRNDASHKGHVGLLLCIGSHVGMPGAIRLAGEAALRTGASLVAVCCDFNNHHFVVNGRPELMLAPSDAESLMKSHYVERAKAMLIGPGLGQNEWSSALFQLILEEERPLVVDADALQLLAKSPCKRKHWVLTPHPGEAAKLLNCTISEVEENRFDAVKAIAKKFGGICVLKGAGSLISDGEIIWINTSGNSGMASGGMGDVLSGIIAALLMQLSDPMEATRLAVYLHGKAADDIAKKQGKIGMLASDLFLPIQQLLNK